MQTYQSPYPFGLTEESGPTSISRLAPNEIVTANLHVALSCAGAEEKTRESSVESSVKQTDNSQIVPDAGKANCTSNPSSSNAVNLPHLAESVANSPQVSNTSRTHPSANQLRKAFRDVSPDEAMLFLLTRSIGATCAEQCAKAFEMKYRPNWFQQLSEWLSTQQFA